LVSQLEWLSLALRPLIIRSLSQGH
jgi:hypothetical protein